VTDAQLEVLKGYYGGRVYKECEKDLKWTLKKAGYTLCLWAFQVNNIDHDTKRVNVVINNEGKITHIGVG